MKELAGRLGLLVMSVLVTLAGLELGCRLWRGPDTLLAWPNLVAQQFTNSQTWCDNRDDPELGWVPTPGCAKPLYHHDADGFRVVPSLSGEPLEGPPLLITGDSYAYGEEVADGETWAAYLQTLIGARTINAGVPGYGLDQIVLRSERLAASLAPAVLVVTFIPDDIERNEMGRLWGGEKPYFELIGDRLELRRVPVPPSGGNLLFWPKIFGWSLLVDTIARRLGLVEEWYFDDRRVLPKGSGERMVCPLMRRLARLATPTLVVAQYPPGVWRDGANEATEQRRLAQLVLRCADAAGLPTLDTFQLVNDAVRARGPDALYRIWHHNAEGNHLIAQAIVAELRRRHMLPR